MQSIKIAITIWEWAYKVVVPMIAYALIVAHPPHLILGLGIAIFFPDCSSNTHFLPNYSQDLLLNRTVHNHKNIGAQ